MSLTKEEIQNSTFLLIRTGEPVTAIAGSAIAAAFAVPAIPTPDKPTTKPTPKPEPETPTTPIPTEVDLLGEQVGERAGNPIYVSKDYNLFYEKADNKLWPRGSDLHFRILTASGGVLINANPTPSNNGIPGVPQKYTLPTGWGWFKAPDGAFAIVPHLTTEQGPAWLQGGTDKATQPKTVETIAHYVQIQPGQ